MGLGAARDLARRGVPITLVHCGAGRPPAGRSRLVRFRNAPDIEHTAAVVEWLCELARGAPVKPVLVPAQDHAVLLIQGARAKLAQHFHFYLWDSELLTQLASKTGLGRIAERYGLPAPRTASPRSRAEAEELCSRLRLPFIVKPEFTNSWWTETARSLGLGEKAIEVANTEELLSVYDRSQHVGAKIVVQEKIVGPDSNHMSYLTFVAPDGTFSGEMIARKLRVYPVRFGVASYAESATTDDAMRIGKDILHRLGYRGFASVQMKRDERDGRLLSDRDQPTFSAADRARAERGLELSLLLLPDLARARLRGRAAASGPPLDGCRPRRPLDAGIRARRHMHMGPMDRRSAQVSKLPAAVGTATPRRPSRALSSGCE